MEEIGLPLALLSSANISIEFAIDPSKHHLKPGCYIGNTYRCSVELIDDNGKKILFSTLEVVESMTLIENKEVAV